MNDFAFKKWPPIFADPTTERVFLESQLHDNIIRTTYIICLGMVLFAIFGIADYLFFGPSPRFFELALSRTGYLAASGIFLFVLRRYRQIGFFVYTLPAWIVLTIILNIMVNATRAPSHTLNLTIDTFGILLLYALVPIRINAKICLGLLTTLFSILIFTFLRGAVPVVERAIILMTYVVVNATGLYIAWHTDSLTRKRYAAIETEKQTKRQLEEKIDELKESNAELDAFAHTVAHDLKNPLGGILGACDVLQTISGQKEITPPELGKYLRLIEDSGTSMKTIIDELLLLAGIRKIDDVRLAPLDTDTILKDVRKRLAYHIVEHKVEIRSAGNWPPALGYAPWITEVWANYISNAIKYGGTPPIIEIGATADGSVVRFWVRDNGPGFDAVEEKDMFVEFSRIRKGRHDGHGLGLSIVKRIIQKLGGSVGFASRPGQGSEFYFTLPKAPTE